VGTEHGDRDRLLSTILPRCVGVVHPGSERVGSLLGQTLQASRPRSLP